MKLVIPFALALSLAAQDSRFGVRSPLVLLPVNVTDAEGRSVEDLDPKEILVFDNGRQQKATVDHADTGVAPIALIVAVQTSGISAAVLESVRKVGVMIQPTITGKRGCAGVVGFDQRINWIQECTENADLIGRAFRRLQPLSRAGEEKEGRMLDAVNSAVDRLSKRTGVRRVILLLSESRDRGSETAFADVAAAAQAAGVTIYTATYSASKTAFLSKVPVIQPRTVRPRTPNDAMGTVDGQPSTNKGNMRRLPPEQMVDVLGAAEELGRLGKENAAEGFAKATGGDTFSFTRQKALEETIQKLGAELHSQYIVSFVPEAAPSGYRKLDVRIARPGEYRVRARPGFWVAGDAQ